MAATGAGGATAGASAAAAVAQAIKASGVLVKLEPGEFRKVLYLIESPLVVTAVSSFFGTTYQYLTSYKGLAFYCKSKEPMDLGAVEVIAAQKIWIPG